MQPVAETGTQQRGIPPDQLELQNRDTPLGKRVMCICGQGAAECLSKLSLQIKTDLYKSDIWVLLPSLNEIKVDLGTDSEFVRENGTEYDKLKNN